jgi:hypothetical protein
MSRAFPFLLIARSASLGGRGLHAQTAPADPTVVASVQRLFDAMAAHDTAAARSLLVPGTRFVSISNDTGAPGARPAPSARPRTRRSLSATRRARSRTRCPTTGATPSPPE